MRFSKTDSGTLNSLHLNAYWVPWVLDAKKERRFKTVDVRCYRRGMKIKGTNKITNEGVLKATEPQSTEIHSKTLGATCEPRNETRETSDDDYGGTYNCREMQRTSTFALY